MCAFQVTIINKPGNNQIPTASPWCEVKRFKKRPAPPTVPLHTFSVGTSILTGVIQSILAGTD